MRLFGVLWNSIGESAENAINDIQQQAKINHLWKVDLGEDYVDFINLLKIQNVNCA